MAGTRKRPVLRGIAAMMSLVLLLSGCGVSASDFEDGLEKLLPAMEAEKTISEDSKWINSDVDGAITADTPTNLKDDFHTAVNKEWILDQTLTEDEKTISGFTGAVNLLEERELTLLRLDPENTDGLDPEVMDKEKLIHIQKQVLHFTELAGDWESRNEAGSEPLRPYIEAVEKIQSLSDMTEYLKDTESQKLSKAFFIPFRIDAPMGTDTENYSVYLTAETPLALADSTEYNSLSFGGVSNKELTDMSVRDVLGSLGYGSAEIQRILKECYRFETALAESLPARDDLYRTDFLVKNHHEYSREEIAELEGNYPLLEILESYGYGDSEHFTVTIPKELSNVSRLYTEGHLSEMKSYYIVHTVLDGLVFLDKTCFEESKTLQAATSKNSDEDEDEDEAADNALLDTFQNFVFEYFSDAYQQMYIGHYCSSKTKQALLDMTEDIVGAFREMIAGEEWMSEETKEKAYEKLDFMGIHVLYPDEMTDYSTLDISSAENLVAAIADINRFNLMKDSKLVNQPVDRSRWNLETIPTAAVNAAYMVTDNSINIEAGIVTDDFFREDGKEEKNLAKLGCTIGHEISHGFDAEGYMYDKNGHLNSWWTKEDQEQFEIRVARVEKYYDGLTPLPQTKCSGKKLSGEAIADMGGMRCVLNLAKKKKDFDYDLFFRSYAEFWRYKTTYYNERQIMDDVHPLSFLRTNVTVSQFDEFYDCYDIQPGDGMYVDKASRIAVW